MKCSRGDGRARFSLVCVGTAILGQARVRCKTYGGKLCFKVRTGFELKVLVLRILCATLCFSVSLWLMNSEQKHTTETQRTQRGCTEKRIIVTFTAKLSEPHLGRVRTTSAGGGGGGGGRAATREYAAPPPPP